MTPRTQARTLEQAGRGKGEREGGRGEGGCGGGKGGGGWGRKHHTKAAGQLEVLQATRAKVVSGSFVEVARHAQQQQIHRQQRNGVDPKHLAAHVSVSSTFRSADPQYTHGRSPEHSTQSSATCCLTTLPIMLRIPLVTFTEPTI